MEDNVMENQELAPSATTGASGMNPPATATNLETNKFPTTLSTTVDTNVDNAEGAANGTFAAAPNNNDNGTTHAGSTGENTRRTLSIPPFKKDSRKLFVGGLPADITDDEFRAFFEEFGELVDSVVMFDYQTHRSRGFGFVTFRDPEVSGKMLKLGHDDPNIDTNNGTTGRIQMRDKLIEIKAAEPKEGKGRSHHNHHAGQNYSQRRGAHTSASRHSRGPTYPAVGAPMQYDYAQAPYDLSQQPYYYGNEVPVAPTYPYPVPHYTPAPAVVPLTGAYIPAPGAYVPAPVAPYGFVPPPVAPVAVPGMMVTPLPPHPSAAGLPVGPPAAATAPFVSASVMQPATPGIPSKLPENEEALDVSTIPTPAAPPSGSL